jgi:hypothetical protein
VLNNKSLPLEEWVLLFKITYRAAASYTTVGKCRIENVESYTGSRATTTLAGTGITQAFADSTYLRLDGSNDPITGDITIGANLSAINISATTLTVGNISNTEFSYLDTVSANIQTQLSNLSGTKVDKTTTITAGVMLSGGGDLSTNRTISHQTVGSAGTYSNIVTNSTGHITSARNITSADIPNMNAIKITPTKFLQTIPSQTWIINHDLDRYPHLAVRLTTTGYEGFRVEPTIYYNDENTVTLTFSQLFTGAVHLS